MAGSCRRTPTSRSLGQLCAGLAGAALTAGHPAVVDGDWVVRALATGTSGLLLRLGDGPARAAVLAHGGVELPELGPEWVRADPWLSTVPSAEGIVLLRAWLGAAFGYGAEN